jgi:hypothetical protein
MTDYGHPITFGARFSYEQHRQEARPGDHERQLGAQPTAELVMRT